MSVRPRLFDGLEQRIAAARIEQIGRINQREFAGAVMAADEQLRAQAARTIDRNVATFTFRLRLPKDQTLLGVVGALQFDVLADRIRTEYSIPVRFEPTSLYTARWVESDDGRKLKQFAETKIG